MGRCEGKVAFISGAARGQGRSHAALLASEGADIIGFDLCGPLLTTGYEPASWQDLEETERLVEKEGRRMIAFRADVRDYHEVKSGLDAAVAEFGGRLDIVAANAGIVTYGRAHELTDEVWQETIDVNLTGVWHTVKAAVPLMIAAGNGGSITITSSLAGLVGMANTVHYTATKHGVVGMMKTLVNELGQYSIRVNTIHPTNVNTHMLHNPGTYALFEPDVAQPSREGAMQNALGMHVLPIAQIEPIDMSNALLFLASDQARYVTGATLPIDGGASTKF
ncbi:mycofactocin-coupled SDR family oxidoreductase [Mycobacterium sp. CVI_P3]|uniref:Mycofactocin-coupled SDR family oxidoreductase n=1 Tax=Mycobacterium pinniadriaticum TaxID=2994102 RepID=A0ABT3SF26_9MYCO|nr:mycofactocin-coupled SDR family oxidoreductase [Mycobacterium pinniadriaticum]MCX2931807.1 mycofactocin-coupled SDR family oxidoreductase [Mycobacterium pinniadriaticum]MCX2938118.1 mycofactocin-coupled SDR family oxidoreductase [Mycobacterium pinniadriaticum]